MSDFKRNFDTKDKYINDVIDLLYTNFNRFNFQVHQYPNAIGLWPGDIETLLWSLLKSQHNYNWMEIGSFCGGSAVLMCLLKKILKLSGLVISVDRRPEKILLDNVSYFEDMHVLLKTTSDNIPKFYSGEPISFIFIDGWHSFKGCLTDFLTVKPYLTDNAIICIHDTAEPFKWTENFIEEKYNIAKEKYELFMSEILPNPNTQEQTYNLDEVIAFMIKEHNCKLLKTNVSDHKTYMIPLVYSK